MLSDPVRRQSYDSSLRDGSVEWHGLPARTSTNDGDDDEGGAGGAAASIHGLLWILVLVVLGLIFVFSAYAGGPAKDLDSNPVAQIGDCVKVSGSGEPNVVPCGPVADGLVVAVIRATDLCPIDTKAVDRRRDGARLCLSRL